MTTPPARAVGRLAVLLLHSTAEPERAVAALRAALAAAERDRKPPGALLLLDDDGVRLGARGVAEAISGGGRPDVRAIFDAFAGAGGRVLVSSAAWKARGYLDTALIPGSSLCGPEALAEAAADGYAIASF